MLLSNDDNLHSEAPEQEKMSSTPNSKNIPPELINTYQSRLKGHTTYPRQELLLLTNYLTDSEYLLYSVIRDVVVDWDERHSKYGKFTYDIAQLAYITNWNESKVRRLFNHLKFKGMVILLHRPTNLFGLCGYGEYKQLQKFKIPADSPFKYIETFCEKIEQNCNSNHAKLGKQITNLKTNTCNFIESFNSFPRKSSSSSNKFSLNVHKSSIGLTEEDMRQIDTQFKDEF